MINQNDKKLNRLSSLPFAEYACALFDIIYYGEKYGKYTFELHPFLNDVDNWIKAGTVDLELTIMNWDKLCADIGLPYKLVFENKTHKLPSSRKLKKDEIQLLYLFNPTTGYHHFVCADGNDEILFDSLGNSVTGRAYNKGTGYIETRRVFRRVK